jgi:hypothetical protein
VALCHRGWFWPDPPAELPSHRLSFIWSHMMACLICPVNLPLDGERRLRDSPQALELRLAKNGVHALPAVKSQSKQGTHQSASPTFFWLLGAPRCSLWRRFSWIRPRLTAEQHQRAHPRVQRSLSVWKCRNDSPGMNRPIGESRSVAVDRHLARAQIWFERWSGKWFEDGPPESVDNLAGMEVGATTKQRIHLLIWKFKRWSVIDGAFWGSKIPLSRQYRNCSSKILAITSFILHKIQ